MFTTIFIFVKFVFHNNNDKQIRVGKNWVRVGRVRVGKNWVRVGKGTS